MTDLVAVPERGLPGLDEDGWPILPPTLVSVHRTSPGDERSRQVVVTLDGRRVSELLYGQHVTVEVMPGPHELRAHNTLMWRRVPFHVTPGAHVHFTVVNRAPAGYYALLLVIGVAPLFLSVEQGRP